MIFVLVCVRERGMGKAERRPAHANPRHVLRGYYPRNLQPSPTIRKCNAPVFER